MSKLVVKGVSIYSILGLLLRKFLLKRGKNLISYYSIGNWKIRQASLDRFVLHNTVHQLKGLFDLHNLFKRLYVTFFYEGGVPWLLAN